MKTPVLQRETSLGRIEGLYSEKTGTLSYLGVPYAAPPLGELRFRAPQAAMRWEDIRPAKILPPASVQKGKNGVIGSEDCLYLNLYRPAGEEEKLPVFFFLHGGNNQTDSGAMMDGDVMAEGLGALVVTVNFRLNSLGWLSLPALRTGDPLEDSGNFGLLDIRAALLWVRENAAAFGGDCENITVCGYSSGGRDLLCMLISPLFEGLFARAPTFSAGFTTTEPEEGAQIAARAFAPLAVSDGRAKDEAEAYAWLLTPGEDVREWLCSLPAERFGDRMCGAAIRMRVFPHLFADGAVIPKEGFEILREGRGMRVPMMFLSGGREFCFQANNDPLFKNADFSDPEVRKEYHFAVKYGGALFGYINAEQNAEAFGRAEGAGPVYAGRCLWGMDPAVTDTDAAQRMGGSHGLDLYLLMGIERDAYALTENVWSKRNRPGRIALQKLYMEYISRFIRTGDPNGDGLAEWKPWSGDGCLMLFDADCENARACMSADVVREEQTIEELWRDPSIPEDRKEYIVKNVLDGRFFSGRLDRYARERYPEPPGQEKGGMR